MDRGKIWKTVMFNMLSDNMELFKLFNDNPEFQKELADMVFSTTYNAEGKSLENDGMI